MATSNNIVPFPQLAAAGALQSSDLAAITQGDDVAKRVSLAVLGAFVQSQNTLTAAVAASTANVNIASAPSSLDGITGTPGDRWLLKDQTLPAQNGIYVFNGAGSALTRATDMDTWPEVPGVLVPVQQGTVNADSVWLVTSDDGGTIDTTPITFRKMFGTNLYQPWNAALTLATTAIFRANSANRVIGTNAFWASKALVTLTDAATIAVDMSLGENFIVTLGGNRTLGNPTNAKVGQTGRILVYQDGTGGRTLAFASNYKFASGTAPVVSVTASAESSLTYFVESASRIIVSNNITNIS